MFLLKSLFLTFSLLFCVPKIVSTDNQCFVVLVEHYGPYNNMYARMEIQSDSKAELFPVLKDYFSATRPQNHPFLVAKRAALQTIKSNRNAEIVEQGGFVETSSEHRLPFKLFYGYASSQAACENSVGKQISPADLKGF